MIKKYLILIGVIFCVAQFAGPAFAIPTLGVATDTGIYAYTDPDALTDEYINYFADTLIPAIDGLEGFVIGPSGSSLTVFTSYDPSSTQIYLLADTAGGFRPMTFGGVVLTYDGDNDPAFITGQADGYIATPYSYVALPTDLGSWTTNTFSSGLYYLYEATITYTGGPWTEGYYFFAGAETNGNTPGLQYTGAGSNDDFSPKTSSAGGFPIPEPATMLLLGSSLLGGLVGFEKKRS